MIRIREFMDSDAINMELRPIYPKGVKEIFLAESVGAKSYTLYDDKTEKVFACVSFCIHRPHFAGLNMLCDNAFVAKKKEFIFVLREGVKYFMNELGLKRVQTSIRADFPGAEKWIRLIGFEKEALMKKYGPEQEDHFLFSKVVS